MKRVQGHRRHGDLAGQVGVVREASDCGRVGGEARDARIESCVVAGATVDRAAVVERIAADPPGQILEQGRGPVHVGDQLLFLDASHCENVAQLARLHRGPLTSRQPQPRAGHDPALQFGAAHARARRQSLPDRIGAVGGRRVVAAVELIDGPQVGAELIGPRPAHEDAIGQQHPIIVQRAVLTSRIKFGRLGGDVAAPGLAVKDGAVRTAETRPEDAAAAVGVLGRHAHAVAPAAIGRADPGVALADHDGEAVEVLKRVRRLRRSGAWPAVRMHDQLAVPVLRLRDHEPGAGRIAA